MKRMKRLLSLGMAMVLAFCALNLGMIVRAADVQGPFASLSVGGKAIDTEKYADGYTFLNYESTKAQVKWTLNRGWTLTDAHFLSSDNYKSTELQSGGIVKVPRGGSTQFTIRADNGSSDCSYTVSIYNGKASLLNCTVWMGSGENAIPVQGFSPTSELVSITSSDTGVLTVQKGVRLYECTMAPKKVGSSKVTVVVKINGEKKKFRATFKVRKYPEALTSLQVDGKSVNLSKNHFYARQKVSKDSTKLKFQVGKGWKLKSCTYYDESKGKSVTVRSGGSVKTPRSTGGAWVVFTLMKGSDLFYYDLSLVR